MTQKEIIAQKHSEIIKKIAKAEGFDYVGISKAEKLEEDSRKLENWLNAGMHGEMSYMERNFEMRTDPRVLVPGAKSVISLLFNYYTDQKPEDKTSPKISTYAYGEDYHFVMKRKLKDFFKSIQTQIGEIEGRVFVDSAPVLDKAWAKKSGLGWVGKHTLLINKNSGSFFFIAEIISDLELAVDGPIKDYCGSCTRCIDACPTDAIVDAHIVDGSKCISYFTIELKDAIPTEMKGKFDNWMFGCDICQQVCPWNRFSKPHKEKAFEPHEDLLKMNTRHWQELTVEVFNKVFKNSAVKRTKFSGLERNINFLKENY